MKKFVVFPLSGHGTLPASFTIHEEQLILLAEEEKKTVESVDLPTVQKLMGHKTIEMTLHYAHLTPDHLKDSINKLNLGGHYLDTEQKLEGR